MGTRYEEGLGSYDEGQFLNPNTLYNQEFIRGSTLNVTWSTEYPSINLYLIYDGHFADPIPLLSKAFAKLITYDNC